LERVRKQNGLGVDYRVRMKVFTREEKSALTVPRSALFRLGDGGWALFVIRDGRAKLTSVKTGLMNDQRAQVLSEVQAGDKVILAPETDLADGQKVAPAVHGNARR
jgi:HlyD family secretion protein